MTAEKSINKDQKSIKLNENSSNLQLCLREGNTVQKMSGILPYSLMDKFRAV